MRCRPVLLSLIVLAGCGRAASPVAAPAAPSPATKSTTSRALFEPVPPIPAEAFSLSAFSATNIPIASYLHKTLEMPPCFDAQLARVDAFVMISLPAPKGTINALHGSFDRAAFEDCVRQSVKTVYGESPALEHDGRTTKITISRGTDHLAFTDDGWIGWHRDRAVLDAFVAAPRSVPPSLSPLVERARREEQADGVTLLALDLAGMLLGVPSRGALLVVGAEGAGGSSSKGARAVVLFASSADATKAAQQLQVAADEPSRPAALRAALTKTHPRVDGSELHVDLRGFFESVDAMKQATAEMAKHLPGAGTTP